MIQKLKNRWKKFRLTPIRVFCFHQTSAVFDTSTMWECDWTEIGQFKQNILKQKSEYTFITLPEAYEKLKNDSFRVRKYAVLTCDDGWQSVRNILPWLYEQKIPITLFLNPAYLLQEEKRELDRDNLLTKDEVVKLLKKYDNITIGSHGWNHQLCNELSLDTFQCMVDKSESMLYELSGKIEFFAYPCGQRSVGMDEYLLSKGIAPVYCDGQVNYQGNVVHRECIDGKVI